MTVYAYEVKMSAKQFRLFRDMTFYLTQRSMETLVSVINKSESIEQEMASLGVLAKVAAQHKMFQDYMLKMLEQAEDAVDENEVMTFLAPEGAYKLMSLTATMPSLHPESQNMQETAGKVGVPMDLYTKMFNEIKFAISNARRLDQAEDSDALPTMRSPGKYLQ